MMNSRPLTSHLMHGRNINRRNIFGIDFKKNISYHRVGNIAIIKIKQIKN